MKVRQLSQATVALLVAQVGLMAWIDAAHSANQTWDSGGDGIRFHDPLNWSGDDIPGSRNSTATNTTNPDVATFTAAAATTLEVKIDAYRSIGQLQFNGPGDVKLYGFLPSLPILNADGTQATDTSGNPLFSAFRINGADLTDTIRVESGNALLQADPLADGAAIRMGRFNNNWFVADGSTLTFDMAMVFVNSSSTVKKTGAGTVVFKSAIGNSGGGNAAVTTWTISEGKIRVETPTGWRGSSSSKVDIKDGAMLELVNSNYGENNGTLTLRGNGIGGLGALHVTGGTEARMDSYTAGAGTVTAQIVVATDASIGVDTGSTFTLAHGIGSAGAGNLTKVGGGTLVFQGNNSLPTYGYAGTVRVAAGQLLVNTQAADSTVDGSVDAAVDGRMLTLSSNAGLTVGQSVSGVGVGAGAFITDVAADGVTVVVSQYLETGTGSYTFGGVSSALNTSPVIVQTGGTLGGSGSISGSAVTVNAGGTLAPGAGIGTFTVGSATIGGTLAIEFNGSAIDKLSVAGALDISGATLALSNLGDLTGSGLVIAEYGSLVGSAFATVTGLPSGYSLDYNYQNSHEIALVGSVVPGDFDSDGDVDGADFIAWQTHYPTASGATLATGDANGDGKVDGADFAVWQNSFPVSPAATTAVPEPTAAMLAMLSAVFLGVSRCCGRKQDRHGA